MSKNSRGSWFPGISISFVQEKGPEFLDIFLDMSKKLAGKCPKILGQGGGLDALAFDAIISFENPLESGSAPHALGPSPNAFAQVLFKIIRITSILRFPRFCSQISTSRRRSPLPRARTPTTRLPQCPLRGTQLRKS